MLSRSREVTPRGWRRPSTQGNVRGDGGGGASGRAELCFWCNPSLLPPHMHRRAPSQEPVPTRGPSLAIACQRMHCMTTGLPQPQALASVAPVAVVEVAVRCGGQRRRARMVQAWMKARARRLCWTRPMSSAPPSKRPMQHVAHTMGAALCTLRQVSNPSPPRAEPFAKRHSLTHSLTPHPILDVACSKRPAAGTAA